MLARVASRVVGVDISEEAVQHARAVYGGRDNLSFLPGACENIPCESGSIEVAVSFETIEHIEQHEVFLSEIRRVLTPHGILILSSPNKKTYSDDANRVNPFHKRELYQDELETLLSGSFASVTLFGQRLTFSSHLWPLRGPAEVTFRHFGHSAEVDAASGQPPFPPDYYIAVCGPEQVVPRVPASLYTDTEDTLFRDYHERGAWGQRLDRELTRRDNMITTLSNEVNKLIAQRDGPAASPAPADAPGDAGRRYQLRVASELACYEGDVNVHDLPEINDVVNNVSLCIWLKELTGHTDHMSWWVSEIDALLRLCDRPLRMLSIGCGNGDIELDLLSRISAPGRVHLSGYDINPAMIARGNALARERGLANALFEVHDLNSPTLEGEFDVVLASHSLHHVTDLERLFAAVAGHASTEMIFLINDMIGRNGHVMWPNARPVVQRIWKSIGRQYKLNAYTRRYDDLPMNHDCSTKGFEGIRAQDILPLLTQWFDPDIFLPFSTIINRFTDRPYGRNFRRGNAEDVDLIMKVLALDVHLLKSKKLAPTQAFMKFRKKGEAKSVRYLFQTPTEAVETRHAPLDASEYEWEDEVPSSIDARNPAQSPEDLQEITRLEALLRRDPELAIAHNDLGALYCRTGVYAKALEHFQLAHRYNPRNLTTRKNLADALLVLNRTGEALRHYEEILKERPDDIETLHALGHACIAETRLNDAAGIYKRVLTIDPANDDAAKLLGMLRQSLGEEQELATLQQETDRR
jgi:2-polyprenyl-3-methyl-5-hydroxy-6-metoxy-1,4-benzoquinol methylase/tetratricopeptide (TPR) repeat protein